MTEKNKIIGVRFKCNPKTYNFWGPKESLSCGDKVAVNTPLGVEVADVVDIKDKLGKKDKEPTQTIERKISAEELDEMQISGDDKEKYLELFKKTIEKYNLSMKPLGVETCVGNKLIFIFSSIKRVDFRDLVKELIHKLNRQVVLKQVGPRDVARQMGGIGPCGRKICCKQFLGSREGITMDMARNQGMSSKGASKISGACGRLMCCLRFEDEYYKEAQASLPKVGESIRTKEGRGRVVSINLLEKKAEVELDNKIKTEVEF